MPECLIEREIPGAGAEVWGGERRMEEEPHRMPHIILIAEDDAATLAGLATYLHGAGYSVVPAANFADGRQLLAFARPDVVIADVRLGEYNGLQLVVHARSLESPPAAIVTSGFSDPVIEAEARQMDATFLLKPIDPAHLLALIGRLIALR
jgi:two-component system, NtrC family, response regulator AtoC